MSEIVVSLGEVLLDVFPSGAKLGGAPLNFAWYASQLGAKAYMVSAVGQDADGSKILREMSSLGLETKYVLTSSYPTGRVHILLDENKVPSYEFLTPCAWDDISVTPEVLSLCQQADVVCFGSLAQRNEKSHLSLMTYLNATSSTCLRIFDVNLRQRYYSRKIVEQSLQLAHVLKVSEEEFPVLAALLGQSLFSKTILQISEEWRVKYHLELIIITRGKEGSILKAGKVTCSHEGKPSRLVSTVGAGDSFTATAVMNYLRGASLDDCNERANTVASYVCAHEAAMVLLPQDIFDL